MTNSSNANAPPSPKGRRRSVSVKEKKAEFPDKFQIISADLSLRRPGFCRMNVEITDSAAEIKNVLTKSVDNKKTDADHGEILNNIVNEFQEFVNKNTDPELLTYFVREQAINVMRGRLPPQNSIGIFKVVGVMDYIGKTKYDKTWYEIYPTTAKKLVSGKGTASKDEMQTAVKKFFPDAEFANDDESDAAGIGLAFLLKNNLIKNKEDESDVQ